MCGGVIFQQTHGTIYSPRWPGPYQHNLTCDWTVHVPRKLMDSRDQLHMTLRFPHFDMEPDRDLLSIHSLDSILAPSPETYAVYHGGELPPSKLKISLSDVRSIIIHFESDHTIKHFGFTLVFSSEYAAAAVAVAAVFAAAAAAAFLLFLLLILLLLF